LHHFLAFYLALKDVFHLRYSVALLRGRLVGAFAPGTVGDGMQNGLIENIFY